MIVWNERNTCEAATGDAKYGLAIPCVGTVCRRFEGITYDISKTTREFQTIVALVGLSSLYADKTE
jgi:hypothetical protein